ncbi:hypothetical protein [Pseudomonas putida]|uniref:hypothetical protein n=1 Tax=Pseudomonas putida TaxID=303 RepID=UPI0010754E0F|nr:hypothetical protein [Pseudomonas putida]MCG3644548.1 hypothetical protein [Pseudomonas putida]TFW21405.1 hypothetical protein E4L40_19255 [Pseudomonas putida]
MTDFAAPSAAHLAVLAGLSDSDLLAPLAPDEPSLGEILALPTVAPVALAVTLPDLDSLLAQADSIAGIHSTTALPARQYHVSGVPATEQVSGLLRGNGSRLSRALHEAVGEHIKTADDLRYALRVFAAHAVDSLIGNRFRDLLARESLAAQDAHAEWQGQVLTAVQGEVAAIQAAGHLTEDEFKFLLELVDSNRCGMAQNLAGDKVDVSALAKGRGTDWRALAEAWASACHTRGAVTFEAGKNAAGWCSYSLDVQPDEGWVLSVYVDQQWLPIQASAKGKARAAAARAHVMLTRSEAAKPAPYTGVVFADELRGAV